MGLFEGILLASDWDGTLFTGETVPEKSRNAIEYFKSEGGLFCICSGRPPKYLQEKSHLLTSNTYSIFYGGALIKDLVTGKILREGFVDTDACDIVKKLINCGAKTERISVMKSDGDILFVTPLETDLIREAVDMGVYKLALTGKSNEDGKLYSQFAKDYKCEKYTLARSFPPYIEIMKTEYTKGKSAKILKDHLGARLLVTIGDYENDIPMFREADISFAVGNAVDELKSVATKTVSATVHESAVAEVIEELKNI